MVCAHQKWSEYSHRVIVLNTRGMFFVSLVWIKTLRNDFLIQTDCQTGHVSTFFADWFAQQCVWRTSLNLKFFNLPRRLDRGIYRTFVAIVSPICVIQRKFVSIRMDFACTLIIKLAFGMHKPQEWKYRNCILSVKVLCCLKLLCPLGKLTMVLLQKTNKLKNMVSVVKPWLAMVLLH